MNTENRKINKKFSSRIEYKLAVRLKACEQLKSIKVLDCYHGKGELWRSLQDFVEIEEFLGIEKNKGLGSGFPVMYGNNLQIIDLINIDKYTLIDLDAYGFPFDLMEKVFIKSKLPKVIVYTVGFYSPCGIPDIINVFPESRKICKTITNCFYDDMFSHYLYSKGIKEYFECYAGTGMRMRYGYFVYNPK